MKSCRDLVRQVFLCGILYRVRNIDLLLSLLVEVLTKIVKLIAVYFGLVELHPILTNDSIIGPQSQLMETYTTGPSSQVNLILY